MRELRREGARRLREAGVPSPEYDADELLAFVLGVTRPALALVDGVTPVQRAAFDALVKQAQAALGKA